MLICRYLPPTHGSLGRLGSNCRNDFDRNRQWDFSNKVTVLSFAMCVMIVYLHLKFLYLGNHTLSEIHRFLLTILNTCVPTFFAISGYLFFRNFKIYQLKDKIYRRLNSLLIPYLIWNVVYVAFMIVMGALNLTDNIVDISFKNILISIVNAECSPLWFIRYLLLFVIIAPLTYCLFRSRLIGAISLIAILLFNYYNFRSGLLGTHINVNANNLAMFNYQYAYYALGAYFALNFRSKVESVDELKKRLGAISIILLICLYWLYLKDNGTMASFHLFRFLWIPALWMAIDNLPVVTTRKWMKLAFFIYCSHMLAVYCIQGVMEKIYARIDAFQTLFACAEYILTGIIVVYLLICIAELWKKVLPSSYRIVSGSRG